MDHRLRALEREAQAGDPAARVRLLQERVRAGALAADRLRLAAWLGDATARAAVPDPTPSGPDTVRALVEGLEHWGREALARAAVAAAAAALPLVPAQVVGDSGAQALQAARRRLDREEDVDLPGIEACLDRLQGLAHLTPDQLFPPGLAAAEPELSQEAYEQAVARATAEGNAAVFAARAVRGAAHVVCWLSRDASLFSIANYARDVLFDAVGALGEPAVLAAVRGELEGWALR